MIIDFVSDIFRLNCLKKKSSLCTVHTPAIQLISLKCCAQQTTRTSPSGEVSSHIHQSALKMNVNDQIVNNACQFRAANASLMAMMMSMVVGGREGAAHGPKFKFDGNI